jgi:hypothetical protein
VRIVQLKELLKVSAKPDQTSPEIQLGEKIFFEQLDAEASNVISSFLLQSDLDKLSHEESLSQRALPNSDRLHLPELEDPRTALLDIELLHAENLPHKLITFVEQPRTATNTEAAHSLVNL